MIKFIAAAVWICAVTLGAVFYSFQSAGAKPDAPPPPPLMGGLDYIKSEMISVPVLKSGIVEGYFLGRFVYTVSPEKMAILSVPAETLILDQVYTYVFGNPQLDFARSDTIDLGAFRKNVRESINARLGQDLVQDVLIEQVDFLTKDEIRDNAIRRRLGAGATAREMAKGFKEH